MSADAGSNSPTRALLPFELGGHLLAIDATVVIEVTGPRDWVAIPKAPPAVPARSPGAAAPSRSSTSGERSRCPR
ncbi:hypothetical protein G6O69_37645 [Pseudenhygromyxa sp. WMMC2535]|uniref:hypothetical protein n=1 Tax=Pseudenhygromyxa sp. WMMC2535 TaxID=2712867 RepID=UPI0015960C1C|nr:hypothetical protein [Pseudenhygromyxa sp. WMMC2535]NVB43595.1 hypothetical protein [Pseudenhygromyxa sp. WMMC2535]